MDDVHAVDASTHMFGGVRVRMRARVRVRVRVNASAHIFGCVLGLH